MSEELKPCPFCGGEAKITPTSLEDAVIRCTECSAQMRYHGVFNTEEWNTRTTTIPQSAVGALENALRCAPDVGKHIYRKALEEIKEVK